MRSIHNLAAFLSLSLIAILTAAFRVKAEEKSAPAEQPKVSSYAPAEDLAAQITLYTKQLAASLADPSLYNDQKQEAVERDANTLAVLALLLAMNDQDHALKPNAPAFLKAAQGLAENYSDYNQAVKAFAEVTNALPGVTKSDGKVTWEVVAAMSPLMKQVPIIHAPMKRGATDARRFKRQAAQTAGQAATLAAIAQASMFNTDHAEEEQIPAWQKYCAEMRDACGAVNAAVRSGDSAKAAEAIVALQKSCDGCHAVFRAE